MKGYHLFFIFLRAMIILQVILIYFKKQTDSSDIYILLEAFSRVSVGLFLYLFFLLHPLPDLEYGDVLILQFAGILLLVDIDYKGVLGVIRKKYPKFLDSVYRA